MDRPLYKDALEKLLVEETAALTHLEQVLGKEHQALTDNDIDVLERSGDIRQDCVSRLLQVEEERRGLCRARDLPADAQGLDQLLQWCDPSQSLRQRWQDCAAAAARCRDLNERNGALVTARLTRVRAMLGVLTGDGAQARTYGPQGSYSGTTQGARVLAAV